MDEEEQATFTRMNHIETGIFIIDEYRKLDQLCPSASKQEIVNVKAEFADIRRETAHGDPEFIAEACYLNCEYVTIPYHKHPIVRRCGLEFRRKSYVKNIHSVILIQAVGRRFIVRPYCMYCY